MIDKIKMNQKKDFPTKENIVHSFHHDDNYV